MCCVRILTVLYMNVTCTYFMNVAAVTSDSSIISGYILLLMKCNKCSQLQSRNGI